MTQPNDLTVSPRPIPERLQVDLRQAICALAEALSLVGIDEHQHGERVACVAVYIARQLKWNETSISDVFLAGLLHDCGVSSSRVHKSLISAMDWDGAILHCVIGEYYISQFRPLARLATLIRHHHTHWNELDRYKLPVQNALAANLIFLADRIDVLRGKQLLAGVSSPQILATTISKTVQDHTPSHFAPDLVEAFLHLAIKDDFWHSLEPHKLRKFIHDMESEGVTQLFDFDDIYQLAQIFAQIVDAKSDFTYNHSVGVARLSRYLAELEGLSSFRTNLVEIAALLHDLGKLGVPDEMLEKAGPLTKEETEVMHRHSYETFRILSRIKGFEAIAEWAGNHHETLLGNGYPFHHDKSELSLEARIIAIADIFQALIQDRPYRKGLSAEHSLALLQQMARDGRLDSTLVMLLGQHLKASWEHARSLPGDWPLLHMT